MKEKIKTQEGFISIILVMAIVVAVILTAVGVVKYKDEITANISEIFKSKIETPNVEFIGEDEGIEESELTKESIVEEEIEVGEKQDDTQQLQEQLRITEQKRLEAEKQLAEEKATEEEALLKVEKCKSEYNFNKQKLTYEVEAELNILNDLKREIEERMYQDCVNNFIASSGINSSAISGETFSNLANFAKTQCESIIIKSRIESQSDYEKLKNQEYLEIEQELQSQYQDCLTK
jgi:hypothetical protein